MESLKQREEKVNLAIEIAIKVGLVAMVVYLSYLIAKPFMVIVVWAVVAALLIPTYALSGKMIESSQTMVHAIQDGNITIPPPTEAVKEWPIIGEKSYAFWDHASHNLRETLAPFSDEIKKMAKSIFSALGSGLGTILMFVGSMIIAAVFLVGSERAVKFYKDVSRRLMGDKGDEWANLSALTVRSVG
jgi:predicted PurR-regulated permease PerM